MWLGSQDREITYTDSGSVAALQAQNSGGGCAGLWGSRRGAQVCHVFEREARARGGGKEEEAGECRGTGKQIRLEPV